METKKIKLMLLISIALVAVFLLPAWAGAARIKDLAVIEGVRPNQLVGYGLVVGLNGTGDKSSTRFTIQSVANMLERLGVHIDTGTLQVKNVAAVVVTAELKPFARAGTKLDVLVSSLGDASSLMGGTLLLSPLVGVDNQVYAVAQGPVLVGGFQVTGATGTAATKNHPTVGRIPGGATVEQEVEYAINDLDRLTISLENPDFTTVKRVSGAINEELSGRYAQALDAATIQLDVPRDYSGDLVGLIARIEELPVEPDAVAKVVVDERTGTVVVGSQVRISTVAVAYGTLSIQIRESLAVSQPLPFSEGQTTVVPETQITVAEKEQKLMLLQPGVTIATLVDALNAIGVTPRDLIPILQALKAAGALQARLEVI